MRSSLVSILVKQFGFQRTFASTNSGKSAIETFEFFTLLSFNPYYNFLLGMFCTIAVTLILQKCSV